MRFLQALEFAPNTWNFSPRHNCFSSNAVLAVALRHLMEMRQVWYNSVEEAFLTFICVTVGACLKLSIQCYDEISLPLSPSLHKGGFMCLHHVRIPRV